MCYCLANNLRTILVVTSTYHTRRTLETVWLEFGKILYWELTPFMEFQGEGERLKDSEIAR